MKKTLSLFIIGILFLFSMCFSVNAYTLTPEKENIIKTSLPETTTNSITNIVSKWNEQKTYEIYNKIKKIVIGLQIKTLDRTDLNESKKTELVNKYNAVLFIIEKGLSEQYKPVNNIGDGI